MRLYAHTCNPNLQPTAQMCSHSQSSIHGFIAGWSKEKNGARWLMAEIFYSQLKGAPSPFGGMSKVQWHMRRDILYEPQVPLSHERELRIYSMQACVRTWRMTACTWGKPVNCRCWCRPLDNWVTAARGGRKGALVKNKRDGIKWAMQCKHFKWHNQLSFSPEKSNQFDNMDDSVFFFFPFCAVLKKSRLSMDPHSMVVHDSSYSIWRVHLNGIESSQ